MLPVLPVKKINPSIPHFSSFKPSGFAAKQIWMNLRTHLKKKKAKKEEVKRKFQTSDFEEQLENLNALQKLKNQKTFHIF